MAGILLFIVLPFATLVVVGVLIAVFAGNNSRDSGNDHRHGGGSFLDWMF